MKKSRVGVTRRPAIAKEVIVQCKDWAYNGVAVTNVSVVNPGSELFPWRKW